MLQNQAFFAKVLPVVPVIGKNAKIQPVFVKDVAAGVLNAVRKEGTIGKVYEAAGPAVMTRNDLLDLMYATSGMIDKRINLPDFIARYISPNNDLCVC